MRSKRLFIIRHGETDYNLNRHIQGRSINQPLNSTGFKQAEAVCNYLQGYDINLLVCSSLLRSRQTAEPLRKFFKLDILSDRDLDEMDFGEFEGQPMDRIASDIHNIHKTWESGMVGEPVPGGESPVEVFERANRSVMKYISSADADNIAFIVHGRLIRILLSEWTGIGLKNMQQIGHTNGSINQIVWSGMEFKPVYLNKIDHLEEPVSI